MNEDSLIAQGADVLWILALAAALAGGPRDAGPPQGVVTHHHENGAVWYVGEYVDGRPFGTWRYWYDDGRPESEGAFADGAKQGRWVHWHRAGAKASEGEWDHGLKTGLWTTYDEDGAWKSQATWVSGRLEGLEVRWNRPLDGQAPPDLHYRLDGLPEARALVVVALPPRGRRSDYAGLNEVFGDIP